MASRHSYLQQRLFKILALNEGQQQKDKCAALGELDHQYIKEFYNQAVVHIMNPVTETGHVCLYSLCT